MNSREKDIMQEIMKNSMGNIYFFLSQEANAPNNSSINLEDLIKKSVPIANTLNRHINIYGYNPEEGINFVCRVNPGGGLSANKITGSSFIATASEIDTHLIKLSFSTAGSDDQGVLLASVMPEDIAGVLGSPELANLIADKVIASDPRRPQLITKPFHRKLRDKAVREKEAKRRNFDPDQSIYEPDTKDEMNLQELFSTLKDEDEINIKLK